MIFLKLFYSTILFFSYCILFIKYLKLVKIVCYFYTTAHEGKSQRSPPGGCECFVATHHNKRWIHFLCDTATAEYCHKFNRIYFPLFYQQTHTHTLILKYKYLHTYACIINVHTHIDNILQTSVDTKRIKLSNLIKIESHPCLGVSLCVFVWATMQFFPILSFLGLLLPVAPFALYEQCRHYLSVLSSCVLFFFVAVFFSPSLCVTLLHESGGWQ